jgi:hypothetical protein
VPELEPAGEREHGDRAHHERLGDLDTEQDELLRHPVREDSTEQHREQHAGRAARGDHGQFDRAAAHLPHLEHKRDEPDPGAEQRHGQ